MLLLKKYIHIYIFFFYNKLHFPSGSHLNVAFQHICAATSSLADWPSCLIARGGSYCTRFASLSLTSATSHVSLFVSCRRIQLRGSLFPNWGDHQCSQVAFDFFFFPLFFLFNKQSTSAWPRCFSRKLSCPLVQPSFVGLSPLEKTKNNVGKHLHWVLPCSQSGRPWRRQQENSGRLRECGKLEGVWKSLGGGHTSNNTCSFWESAARYEGETHTTRGWFHCQIGIP